MKITAIRITAPAAVYVTETVGMGAQTNAFQPGDVAYVKPLPEADQGDQISAENATLLLTDGKAEPYTPA